MKKLLVFVNAVGLVFSSCICAQEEASRSGKKGGEHLAVRASWARDAMFEDIVNLMVDANNAVRWFGVGGKRLTAKQRKMQLKAYIEKLNSKKAVELNDNFARRKLFQRSIYDAVTGLIRSMKRDKNLSKIVGSKEFKAVAKKVKFSLD